MLRTGLIFNVLVTAGSCGRAGKHIPMFIWGLHMFIGLHIPMKYERFKIWISLLTEL